MDPLGVFRFLLARVPELGGSMARLSRLSRSIEGQVALITGAASGMGRATAHLFS